MFLGGKRKEKKRKEKEKCVGTKRIEAHAQWSNLSV
jgi:hypothetical protein